MYLNFGINWGFIPWEYNCYRVFRNPTSGYLFRGDNYWLNLELEEEECNDIFDTLESSETMHFNFESCLNNLILIKAYSINLFTTSDIEDILENFASLANVNIETKKVAVILAYLYQDGALAAAFLLNLIFDLFCIL